MYRYIHGKSEPDPPRSSPRKEGSIPLYKTPDICFGWPGLPKYYCPHYSARLIHSWREEARPKRKRFEPQRHLKQKEGFHLRRMQLKQKARTNIKINTKPFFMPFSYMTIVYQNESNVNIIRLSQKKDYIPSLCRTAAACAVKGRMEKAGEEAYISASKYSKNRLEPQNICGCFFRHSKPL